MPTYKKTWAALPAACLALAGCALGPDFNRPDSAVHAAVFDEATATAAPSRLVAQALEPSWWQLFNDPTLVALERDALQANFDLRLAAARVEQSRAALAVTGAALLPTVGANASHLRERASPNGILSLMGASAAVGPASASGADPFGTVSMPGEKGSPPYTVSQYGVDASWELDLWGRVRRQREAAAAELSATHYDAQAMRVSVTAEVARVYLELRGVQDDARVLRANAEIAEQSLRVAQRRREQGVATRFDTSVSAAQLESIRSQLPVLAQRARTLMNALALLLGQAPHALDSRLTSAVDIPPLPARVPVGLPSELAHRRPDILRAEAQLHAATAAIGVAQAEFYPSVNLTGSFGFQSLKFAQVGNWASRQFAVGPVLHLPLFDGGRLKGNLALADARQQEAAIGYQRTVLTAWHEVANAMTAYAAVQQSCEHLALAAEQNRQALGSAQRRYRQGAADYLNVLVAQQRLLDSEHAASRGRTETALAMVTLYRTLGGGWDAAVPAGESE